jgi:Tfp pilus assembly protein PilN
MRRLALDYLRRQPAHVSTYALLLLGGVAMAVASNHYRALSADLDTQRATAQQSRTAARSAASVDPRASKALEDRMYAAQVVRNEIGVPWDGLFQALESVDQKDVALLGLSPDAAKKQIKLSGEAKNLEAMVAYHRKLAGHPAFSEVSLSEHDVVQKDPQLPIRFTATATWMLANDARK